MSQPGWYPDPLGNGQRYFDGLNWGPSAPPPDPPGPPTPAGPIPAGIVTTGPNHALHAVLTLFTFWLCGGWAWVWLLVALANRRQTYAVDAFGNRIVPVGVNGKTISPRQTGGLAVVIGIGVLLFLGVAMCGRSDDSKSTSMRSTIAATPSWEPRPTTTAVDDVPSDFKKADILRDVLVERGIHIGTVGEVGTTAQAICSSLRNGQSRSDVADDLLGLYTQLSLSDAAFIVGASTEAFCP